jgi:hypothetical protein
MQQERRRSHRFPALLGRDRALLRVGRDDVEVKLQNESSGGFGILCPPGPQFRVGDALHLRTLTGWFEVKAARVEKTPDGTLLGLDRGREVGNLDRPKHRVPWIGVFSAIGLGLLAVPAVTVFLAGNRPSTAAAVTAPPAAKPAAKQPKTPVPPARRAP